MHCCYTKHMRAASTVTYGEQGCCCIRGYMHPQHGNTSRTHARLASGRHGLVLQEPLKIVIQHYALAFVRLAMCQR